MLVALHTNILALILLALTPQRARANSSGGPSDAPAEVSELHCAEHERLVLWATGDLDGDGRQDLAMIVERSPSTPEERADEMYAPPRVLKLYLRKKQGHLAQSGTFTRAISAQVWSWRYHELLRGMHISPDGTLVVMRWGDETYNTSEFTAHVRRSGQGWFYVGGSSMTASCTGSDCDGPPEAIVDRLDLRRRRCNRTVLPSRFKPVPLEKYEADSPPYLFDGCNVHSNTALRKVGGTK